MKHLSKRNWNDDVYTFLTSIIPSRKGIAAFDFDNTLIQNDFGEQLMFKLSESMPLNEVDFVSHFLNKNLAKEVFLNKDPSQIKKFIQDEYTQILNNKGTEFAYRWTSFLFSGYSLNDLQMKSKKIWNELLNSKSIEIFTEMVEVIHYLQFHNWNVYIVTASPTICIQSVCDSFSINPNHVLGMDLDFEFGFTSKTIIEPFTYGHGKTQKLELVVQNLPDISFGDSENDFPMLCAAKEKGILIEKNDNKFNAKCIENNILLQKRFL
jgi:phosphoserine phosphatase